VRRIDVIAIVRLGRPLFLVGGFVLYGLGAAIAAVTGHAIDLPRYALGQLVVTAFQLMTHYANEYYDFDTDRANATPTAWSGGSRVLADGALPRATALIASLVLAGIGAAAATALVGALAGSLAGTDVLITSALTIAAMAGLSWAYSAPPLRLCARGIGELDTAVVVTGLVPWLAFYLQAGSCDGVGTLIAAIAPLACLQFAMLVAIELPDAAGDAATGKATLVVRLGAARAARLYIAAVSLAYLALAIGGLTALPRAIALAGAAPLPIAIWRCVRIADHAQQFDRARQAAWERIGFWSVALLVATSVAELAAAIALTTADGRWP
jgi:1,4-dihydroxy-2-naphthoate octaprenyltransferase